MSIEITKRIRQEGNSVFLDLEITEESIDKAAKDIEEELFKRIAAKKGYVPERTCHIDGCYYDELVELPYTQLSCGHDIPWDTSLAVGLYCAYCGAKVVDE